jgi:isoquinoline 1-oxidoreductase alpha subunit
MGMAELTINGQVRMVDAPPDMPLLWVLRDLLKLTGTKFGCGIAQCGACTVHVDGAPLRSCMLPISALQAWLDLEVIQCGYCQSGQIMSAAALLAGTPDPDDADIDAAMAGNICRCGTYVRIREAIKHAAKAV